MKLDALSDGKHVCLAAVANEPVFEGRHLFGDQGYELVGCGPVKGNKRVIHVLHRLARCGVVCPMRVETLNRSVVHHDDGVGILYRCLGRGLLLLHLCFFGRCWFFAAFVASCKDEGDAHGSEDQTQHDQ